QDDVESRSVYDMLEQEIVPQFYTRGPDGLPRGWLKRMKRTIATLAPVYNTHRMVAEYTNICYWPSAQRFGRLAAGNRARAQGWGSGRQGRHRGWRSVRGAGVEGSGAEPMRVGGSLQVRARVDLGGLSPDDVEVQLFHGPMDS